MSERPVEALLELTWALAEDQPLEQALGRVAETALGLLPAEHTSVRLLNDSGDELVSFVRRGLGGDDDPASFRPGEGVAGWVCDTGRAAFITDAKKDKRHVPSEPGFDARSVIAVPMLAGGRVVGVLTASHRDGGVFDRRHEGFLRLLANCVTPLIDKARLWRVGAASQLEHALASPLRLRLIAELLDTGELGMSLEDAIVRSGRHKQDVEACLRPMVRWMVVEYDGARYRLRQKLPPEVRETIERVVERGAELIGRERQVRHLLGGMIGVDEKMQMVFEQARSVARLDVTVCITGETGTGKELVARAIHDISPRRRGFFGAVNCATLSETLFESQVFGHVRGAFTGAVQDYMGLCERCHRGTLFLDEVGDLSLTNQVKLLRLLQEGIFTRVGETEPRRSDFRLVSATNRDLEAMVQAGTFREDLYYRLAVFPIRVPSLRQRKGDLKYLVEGILAVQAQRFRTSGMLTITPEAVAQLEKYSWPGNVRELENVMARAAVMAGSGPISPEHLHEVELLSDAPPDSTRPPDESEQPQLRSLEDVERRHIGNVLHKQRGNIKATAEILGISRTTLYKKIRDYDIDAPV